MNTRPSPRKISDDVSVEERNGRPMLALRDQDGTVRVYPLLEAEAAGLFGWLNEWVNWTVERTGGRVT